jgi:hypothetical protein
MTHMNLISTRKTQKLEHEGKKYTRLIMLTPPYKGLPIWFHHPQPVKHLERIMLPPEEAKALESIYQELTP